MKDLATLWVNGTAANAQWAFGLEKSDAEKNLATRSIWAALDDNVQYLAYRLRNGFASREEMAFAAGLIEGKVKRRRPRLGQPTRLMNDDIAQAFCQFRAAYPDWPTKKIVGEIVDIFRLKGKYGRHVYNVLKALDPESHKRHEAYARYAVSHYARWDQNCTKVIVFVQPF
jgi:hypothetical protein